MKQSPLTDLKIRKTKPGKWLADPQHRGLRLYVGDGGIATWWYRHRSLTRTDDNGNPMLDSVKLGVYPRVDLHTARGKWRELKSAREMGIDPKGHATRQKPYTVKELVNDYIDGYARANKKSWRNDVRILEKDLLPRFGDEPASLSRREVKELLSDVEERGREAAEQLLSVCRKAWNVAMEVEKVGVNPFERQRLSKKEKKSRRYWDDLDLQKFLRWLPESQLPVRAQAIAMMQLYTGCRPGEVSGMRWDEVDFTRKTWTVALERHKAGRGHMAPLSSQAIALLQSQPRFGDYVFPSAQDGRLACRRGWYNDVWKKHVDLPTYVTPHGLRHSVITGLAKLRARPEITARIAGHASEGITETVYTHHERDEEAAEWLQKWADHLEALTADNVTVMVR